MFSLLEVYLSISQRSTSNAAQNRAASGMQRRICAPEAHAMATHGVGLQSFALSAMIVCMLSFTCHRAHVLARALECENLR